MTTTAKQLIHKTEVAAALICLAALLLAGCATTTGRQAQGSDDGARKILGVVVESDGGADRVRILGNQPLTFSAVPDPSGRGVRFHFPATVLALDGARTDLSALENAGVLSSVRPRTLAGDDATALIEIAVKADTPYEAVGQGDEVVVTFFRPADPWGAATAPSEPLPEAPGRLPRDFGRPPATKLETITVEREKDGVEIRVHADGPVKDYKAFTLTDPDRIVYDIFGVASRYGREKAIDGALPWVARVRHYGDREKLRVVLDTSAKHFPAVSDRPVEDGLLIQVGRVGAEEGIHAVGRAEGQPGESFAATVQPPVAAAPRRAVPPPASSVQKPLPLADGAILLASDTSMDGEPPAAPADAGAVEFNFDNAELNEVIRTLAEILQIQYVADPNLQGKVTIHTSRPMSRRDLLPLFSKILEVNGLAAVKDGSLYRITSVKDASRIPIGIRSGAVRGIGPPPGEQVIIQLIPLRNLSPGEMAKIVAPFVSENATVVAQEDARTLLVVDNQANVRKILKIVQAFDLNIFSRVHHQFYFLENSSARDIVETLREIFPGGAEGTAPTRFLAIDRINAVLALSTDPDVFAYLDRLMLQFDSTGKATEPRINVYFVKNGTAEELSDLLNQIFTGQPGSARREGLSDRDAAYSFSRNPFARKPKTRDTTTSRTTSQSAQSDVSLSEQFAGEASATLKASVTIIPDPIRNALVIEATPGDYAKVEDILRQLDILPRQVLIEATIAEIGLDDKMNLGVEWEYLRGNNFSETDLARGKISGATGLTYAIEFSNDVLHSLEALAQKNKVNILSSPHVLASDNKEAKIDVADEIPIISSETTVTSGSEPLITTDIQYRDTGVMLSVTPHINDRGLVTMDIYQEVSQLAENVEVAGVSYPSFYKRTVTTTLTVGHGQTIVLGGLIRENKSGGRSGVPVLMDVPILGHLFGSTNRTFSKTELIILLTPRVIANLDDVAMVTEAFERKVTEAMRAIGPVR